MGKKFEVSEFALEAVRHFEFSGTLINVRPFGNGHINDTYLAEYDIFGMGQVKVIIQRMNRNVFKQPEELMENIVNVTEFLKKKIEKNGGDPSRETLNIISSVYGKPFYVDSQGEYWRAYKSLQGHPVMIFQRIQNSFMRVRMHLVISSSCCLITRRKHCTKLL